LYSKIRKNLKYFSETKWYVVFHYENKEYLRFHNKTDLYLTFSWHQGIPELCSKIKKDDI
jgi:hypothetical protein